MLSDELDEVCGRAGRTAQLRKRTSPTSSAIACTAFTERATLDRLSIEQLLEMRTILVDHFEFDTSSSEESLEICVSRQSAVPHPDLGAFTASVLDPAQRSSIAEPVPFFKVAGRQTVSEYLNRFAGVDVPLHAEWPTYQVEAADWHTLHLILCGPGIFIRYRWATSA